MVSTYLTSGPTKFVGKLQLLKFVVGSNYNILPFASKLFAVLLPVGLNLTAMSSTTRVGRSLGDIVARLERFAPLSLAGTWDNVGLLVDPMTNKSVTKMLLTNDLTEDVVEEAIGFKAGLIVSYHPNIFQPIKTVNSR